MSKKVLIIGGEGNGGVIASCIEDNRKRFNNLEYEVAGFINDYEIDGIINGYPVLGGTDDIDKFLEEDYYFMYAIHMIGRNVKSEEVFLKLNIPKERYAIIIHETAFVSDNAVIEPGVFIKSNCYVGPKTHIGQCSLLMANSMIGHDTKVGMLCHFSIGAIVGSYVNIGKVSDVTLGAIVLEKITLGNYAIAGASSLVTKDIPDNCICAGNPARILRQI